MAFYEHKTKKGPVIVAEISGNHGGKLERAQDLMLLAKKHGADAIKIQTYEADSFGHILHKKDGTFWLVLNDGTISGEITNLKDSGLSNLKIIEE